MEIKHEEAVIDKWSVMKLWPASHKPWASGDFFPGMTKKLGGRGGGDKKYNEP